VGLEYWLKEPQVPPLRCAPGETKLQPPDFEWVGRRPRETPVGMTILLYPQELQREILAPATKLSSRPERTRISYFAPLARATSAALLRESRMVLINATSLLADIVSRWGWFFAFRSLLASRAVYELGRSARLKTPILIACFSLSICFGSVFAVSQTFSFQFLQKPGPYPVGLKIVNQYDRSRAYPATPQNLSKSSVGDDARPLQTLIWYPSLRSTGKPMTVGNYAQLADTEIHFDATHPEQNRWRSLLKTSFGIPLWAVRDAKPAKGHYPVLIYAPSDSSVSWENADLCEYLASHGYVILASPSMGVSTRDMTDDLDGINAQARDISFLITYAKTLPEADLSRVAVVSWSWGGASSLFAAARDPRIDALVSMDGSMRYYPGLVKRAGDIHPERMIIPLLFFTAENANFLENPDKDYNGPPADKVGPNVLNAWIHGDLLTVNMLGMAHPEFSSMFQRRESAQRFAENQVADYGRDDANTSHAWVALYMLNFLNAYLKRDASAKPFLERTPAENGVPKHFMGITFRPAARGSNRSGHSPHS
jgi:pimeloyl-ACP methyl ester carboxylesterase